MKPSWRKYIIWLFIIAVLAIIFFQFSRFNQEPAELPLDKVIALSTESQIGKLAINTDILYTTDLEGTKYQTYIGTLNYVDLQNLGLNLNGIDYSYQQTGFDWMSLLIYAVPTIFII
ncbi:MAG: hypothetical protein JW967_09805, partial [Dehalococcoidales bacterium]|nr:hypothetical protein [Dehalococcoidales bacterium]